MRAIGCVLLGCRGLGEAVRPGTTVGLWSRGLVVRLECAECRAADEPGGCLRVQVAAGHVVGCGVHEGVEDGDHPFGWLIVAELAGLLAAGDEAPEGAEG